MDLEAIRLSNQNSRILIDPRTKILLIITISTILIAGGTSGIMHFVRPILASIPFLLLFSVKRYKNAILYIVTYIILFFLEIAILSQINGVLGFVLMAVIAIFSHMLPAYMMGYYTIITTTVSEFVSAMERMHLSQKLVIPMSVVLRFLPTIKEEYASIRDAMKMRNVLTIRTPLKVIEYTVIPLMMSIIKISEELSASALTRGLGGTAKRTNICKIGFGIFDIVMIVISICAWGIFLCS